MNLAWSDTREVDKLTNCGEGDNFRAVKRQIESVFKIFVATRAEAGVAKFVTTIRIGVHADKNSGDNFDNADDARVSTNDNKACVEVG